MYTKFRSPRSDDRRAQQHASNIRRIRVIAGVDRRHNWDPSHAPDVWQTARNTRKSRAGNLKNFQAPTCDPAGRYSPNVRPRVGVRALENNKRDVIAPFDDASSTHDPGLDLVVQDVISRVVLAPGMDHARPHYSRIDSY